MKTSTLLHAMISIMILFSIATATAQSFQFKKKKYSIAKRNGHAAAHSTPVVSFSQDSLNSYTDLELIKLANYIKNLEKGTSSLDEANSDSSVTANGVKAQNKNVQGDCYSDSEIIKLAYYIQYLETKDISGVLAGIKE